jgi:hypothetical protein
LDHFGTGPLGLVPLKLNAEIRDSVLTQFHIRRPLTHERLLETKNIKVGYEKKVFVHQISLDHDIITKEAL